MSSRRKLRAERVARAAQQEVLVAVALRSSIERRKQRAAAAEEHQQEQTRARAQKLASSPRVTRLMKEDNRRADIRMHDVHDIDALGAPKLSEPFAQYLDGTRNTRYRAALRELMLHAPAQGAAYTAMFTSKAWHYGTPHEREACAAEQLHITPALFRRRLWAAVRFVIGAAEGNVPSVVQRYAQEREREISREVRWSRAKHWSLFQRTGV